MTTPNNAHPVENDVDGWVPFGTHAVRDRVPPLEFRGEGQDGLPLWERPIPSAACPFCTREAQRECADPAYHIPPAEQQPPADYDAALGDRVRLWIGPPKRGGWQYGEVVGIDDGTRPGLHIRFDRPVNGQSTCYATHAEVERVNPPGVGRGQAGGDQS